MLESISKLFLDAYDRPARLFPALLVLLPVPVLFVCLFGATKAVETSVVSIAGYCGAGYSMARIARNAGKRLQDRLFLKWGGAPTTQLLRHHDNRVDAHTKERFHAILAAGLGKPMPTAASEASNPVAADELYRAATAWLIGKTRDAKQFPLVFKENVAFGFHRNAFGMRWYGAIVALSCLIASMVDAKLFTLAPPYLSLNRPGSFGYSELLTMGVSMLMLLVWVFGFTEGAARRAGFAYAERLVASCDDI